MIINRNECKYLMSCPGRYIIEFILKPHRDIRGREIYIGQKDYCLKSMSWDFLVTRFTALVAERLEELSEALHNHHANQRGI